MSCFFLNHGHIVPLANAACRPFLKISRRFFFYLRSLHPPRVSAPSKNFCTSNNLFFDYFPQPDNVPQPSVAATHMPLKLRRAKPSFATTHIPRKLRRAKHINPPSLPRTALASYGGRSTLTPQHLNTLLQQIKHMRILQRQTPVTYRLPRINIIVH